MGQLKIEDLKPTKIKTQVHDLLEELSKELDAFYENQESYSKEKLIEIASEFFSALSKALGIQESSSIPSLEKLLDYKAWIRAAQKARRLLRSDEVDDYGCDRSLEMAIKPFFDFLYYKYFRVSVTGIDHIPEKGRALIVANHSGVLPYDASMLKIAIFNEHKSQRELRFLVDDFVFHFPFLGVLMNRIGGVRACPENAERLLQSEELVSVFPEGIKGISKRFSERYHLQRFGRGGVIRLALKTKSPIIPTAVVGAEEIHPLIYKNSVLARPLGLPFIPVTPTFPLLGPLGAIPLPTKWSIHFGEAIYFDGFEDNAFNDNILVNRETEKLRTVIQGHIVDLLKERRSIFFG